MDVSLDTDITIHLYQVGREKLLFKYFDKLYMHEFILEREIRNKSMDVYNRIKDEQKNGRIQIIDTKYLIELGMKKTFEDNLYDIKELFDYGEANAVALASTLGIAALVTDDTKDYGPHETLVKECVEDVIPFAFYELLYLEYLLSDDDFEGLKKEYEYINHIAYPERPMNFLSRIKRVVRRFTHRKGTNRDILWMKEFCQSKEVDYNYKMKLLLQHLKEIQ